MLKQKSFQVKLEEANKVFTSTDEKLKVIQADICTQKNSNIADIERLTQENGELETMDSKISRQREALQKLIE